MRTGIRDAGITGSAQLKPGPVAKAILQLREDAPKPGFALKHRVDDERGSITSMEELRNPNKPCDQPIADRFLESRPHGSQRITFRDTIRVWLKQSQYD